MKRLIVCCDGTWNKLDNLCPTNVLRVAQAIKPIDSTGIPQVVFYEDGLGTQWYDKLPGGAIGWGIDTAIKNAYRFLCFNYELGDEIYLFGFSRGAYTVRSLAGLIHCSGLLSRSQSNHADDAYEIYRIADDDERQTKAAQFLSETKSQKVPIALLGCWDTVGSLGIPDVLPFSSLNQQFNARYQFHNVQLSPLVQNALHAVAVDEVRRVFAVTPMEKRAESTTQVLRQVWFPGEHGCVGGGVEQNRKLSDAALLWMMTEVNQVGLKLELDLTHIQDQSDLNSAIDYRDDSQQFPFRLFGLQWRTIAPDAELHESVKQRWCHRSDYRPDNLALHPAMLNTTCTIVAKPLVPQSA